MNQTSFAFRENKMMLLQNSILAFSSRTAVLPLFTGNLLRFGAPAHRHQSQVVEPVVHRHRVNVDDLKTGGNASSVLLPGTQITSQSPVTKQPQLDQMRALFTDGSTRWLNPCLLQSCVIKQTRETELSSLQG